MKPRGIYLRGDKKAVYSNSFETRRWLSTEYVDFWLTTQEQEEGRRSLRRKLVSLLPFELKTELRILDIGAGGGALSLEILNNFPQTQVICQDFSAAMLAQAAKNLAAFSDRTKFVQSDLADPVWTQSISGTFDAVVSSLVMHTVPDRVKDLYCEVLTLIKPGGCFIFADNLAPPGPIFEHVYLKERLLARQAKIKMETGFTKSLEDIEIEMRSGRRTHERGFPDRARDPLITTLTLAHHLEWLTQAGFNEVDCLWKEMRHAVIGGFKP